MRFNIKETLKTALRNVAEWIDEETDEGKLDDLNQVWALLRRDLREVERTEAREECVT